MVKKGHRSHSLGWFSKFVDDCNNSQKTFKDKIQEIHGKKKLGQLLDQLLEAIKNVSEIKLLAYEADSQLTYLNWAASRCFSPEDTQSYKKYHDEVKEILLDTLLKFPLD